MPRLSILIPFTGAVESFEDTLASVLQNRPDDTQVIVVHAGSYDDPYDLADEVDFLPQPAGTSLAELINTAVAHASAPIVHVLQCGTAVTEGWVEPALLAFQDDVVACVSPLVLDAADLTRVWSRGVNYGTGGSRRSSGAGGRLKEKSLDKVRVLGPSLTAAFYRRSDFDLVDGLDTSLGNILPDVDIALTFAELGLECKFVPSSRVTMSLEQSHDSGSFKAGRFAERLFWRHIAHRGPAASLLFHPFSVLRACLSELPKLGAVTQLFGRFISGFEIGTGSRHRAKLLEAQQRLADQESQAVLSMDEYQSSKNLQKAVSKKESRRAA